MVGLYTLIYDVIDSSSNSAVQVTRQVSIVDSTPPIIALNGPSEIILSQGSSYGELGATCTDNYDTTCTVVVGGDIVDISTLGTYIVTYNTTDVHTNIASTVTRTVQIVDTSVPTITSSNIVSNNPSDPSAAVQGHIAIYTFTVSELLDTVNSSIYIDGESFVPTFVSGTTYTVSYPIVSTTPSGVLQFEYRLKDASGNQTFSSVLSSALDGTSVTVSIYSTGGGSS